MGALLAAGVRTPVERRGARSGAQCGSSRHIHQLETSSDFHKQRRSSSWINAAVAILPAPQQL
ncbi:unnamed protein product, partial [Closterium sp. Naga37s-1]